MFLFVVIWTAVMTVVAFTFELYGLLALLSFVGLAPAPRPSIRCRPCGKVMRAFFYPKAIEELNEIFTSPGLFNPFKRHVQCF